ncbi:MAG: hypothetical protein DIZ80_15160 [endosymbiont of Galathealinum brachiosum]|uniref:Uncharacterized protein n=1 Tax=endosymbiont of Galathealinum brachiosum TaxID=2200906 RepID=A0A370DAM9_9GAMM|nr:MAG: hypothetical protein DIZ80_15160 [endosymbiont of Galathealinum brachiosum]
MSSALIKLATATPSIDLAKYDRLSNILLKSNTTDANHTASCMTEGQLDIQFEVTLDVDGIVTDISE